MSAWDELLDRDVRWATQIREALATALDRIVAERDFGAPTAAKRGRNPSYPYVPVIKLRSDGQQLGGFGSARTRQLRGLAYATREEAIQRAQQAIDSYRRQFAIDLCKPGARDLREHYGLPREPVQKPTTSSP